jgi:hypothetical protein
MSWPRQRTERPAANSSCIWELVITSAIEKAPGGAYNVGMGTIISCYHDPTDAKWPRAFSYEPALLAEILPILQERASAQGWGGSDLPWSWARLHCFNVDGDPLETGGFICPCCGSHAALTLVDERVEDPDFSAYAGQCPGCSIIWWW